MTMTRCVVRNGAVLHVGDWPDQGLDQDGHPINQIPDGSVLGDFDLATTAAGRVVLADDYRALRQDSYPPIGDQLDAIYHAQSFSEEMVQRIADVKSKYPKTAAGG